MTLFMAELTNWSWLQGCWPQILFPLHLKIWVRLQFLLLIYVRYFSFALKNVWTKHVLSPVSISDDGGGMNMLPIVCLVHDWKCKCTYSHILKSRSCGSKSGINLYSEPRFTFSLLCIIAIFYWWKQLTHWIRYCDVFNIWHLEQLHTAHFIDMTCGVCSS